MNPLVLPDVQLIANTWTLVTIPDKVRDFIKFQAKSLGVLDFSFDSGATYIQTVGAGEVLYGNYSNKDIWFRTASLDYVKVMVQDKLY